MRAAIVLVLLMACGHARGPRIDCPAGTSFTDTGSARGCKRADGTWHGPFVSLWDGGKVNKVGAFKEGVFDGPWKVYALDGKLLGEFAITDGTGVVRNWHDNGKLESETPYRDGKQDGVAVTWHPNGQKASESPMKAGWQDGAVTTWSADGAKTYEQPYVDGRQEGIGRQWTPDGKELTQEEEYVHGQRVRLTTYAHGAVAESTTFEIWEPGTNISTRTFKGIDPAWQSCERHDECELQATTCCACGANDYVAVHYKHAEDARKAVAPDCADAECPQQKCQRVGGRCDEGRCVSAE